MKAVPFALASFAVLSAFAVLSPPARADDTIRVCIAASTDGQTLRKAGKLLGAREQMIACARDACPSIVRSHCARWLAEVDAAIPSVVVRAEDGAGSDAIGARLSIDGRPGKLDGQLVRLDPGEHTLAIENDHGGHASERVLLVEGETSRRITLRFPADPSAAPGASVAAKEPPHAPEPTAQRSYVPAGAWVLGGAGILALGAATYFGVAASSDLNNLNATCSPHCSDAQAQPGRTDALFFDVSLVVGGAALAGALVWALAFPSHADTSPPAAAARLEVSPLPGGAFGAIHISY
jgi:hypothetical protein